MHMTLLHFAQSLIYAPSLWNIVLLILLYHIYGFNAYDNGMGTSLIASLDTHRSISRYVASLLAQKSHSSRREQNASLIAQSSSFSCLRKKRRLSLICSTLLRSVFFFLCATCELIVYVVSSLSALASRCFFFSFKMNEHL